MDEEQYSHLRSELRWIGIGIAALLFIAILLLLRP